MSDMKIVPFGSNASDTATLLLAACDDLGIDQSVVRTNGTGQFMAPDEVVAQAGLDSVDEEETEVATPPAPNPDSPEAQTEVQPVPSATPEAELNQEAPPKAAAKKTTAKKTAAPRSDS